MQEVLTCRGCEAEFSRAVVRGRKPHYCSADCRTKVRRESAPLLSPAERSVRMREARAKVPAEVRVAAARAAGIASWRDLSAEQRAERNRPNGLRRWPEGYVRKTPKTTPRQERACSFCGDSVLMTRVQRSCGKPECRLARNAERMRNGAWMKARRAAQHTDEVEQFSRESIYERDGWVCGICDAPVDPALRWPNRMRASLDHIVPLSRGGAHVPENTRCSHLTCNTARGNRVSTPALITTV